MKNCLSPSDRESVWISTCDIFIDAYKIVTNNIPVIELLCFLYMQYEYRTN